MTYRVVAFLRVCSIVALLSSGCTALLGSGRRLTQVWQDKRSIIIRRLIEDNGEDTMAITPLYTAAFEGRKDIVSGLLEILEEVDVDELCTPSRRSSLWIASNNGHADVVSLLLENGALVDKADRYGSTPLLAAAEEGHADVVRVLLQAGADKSLTDEDGDSAISLAKAGGHIDVEALLSD